MVFAPVAVNQTRVLFTAPAALRLHVKKPTATCFFTLAASRWMMIIYYARVSTTEQNLGLELDDLKPAFDASVDQTSIRPKRAGRLKPERCWTHSKSSGCRGDDFCRSGMR